MDKEIKNKLVTRNSFRRYCRTVHFHLSFFFMGVILIYAVSGITMNHLKDFNNCKQLYGEGDISYLP